MVKNWGQNSMGIEREKDGSKEIIWGKYGNGCLF
jgi:hypothetical protein